MTVDEESVVNEAYQIVKRDQEHRVRSAKEEIDEVLERFHCYLYVTPDGRPAIGAENPEPVDVEPEPENDV